MRKNKRDTILLFSTAYLPLIGGAELAAREIMRRIPDKKFVVFTWRYTKEAKKHEVDGNIEIIRVSFPGFLGKVCLPTFITLKAWRLFRSRRDDIILWGMMVTYASVAGYLLKRIWEEVPFIMTLQEGDSDQHIQAGRFGLINFFHERLLQGADVVQVISKFLKERAESYSDKEIVVIPNGVDIEKFREQSNQVPEIFLGIEKEKRLISVSRLVEKNGISTIIHAVANLPDFHLFLLGDGVLRNELEVLAEKLEVSERVHFLGEIPYEDLPKYLRAAEVFIRPSSSEGFGTAFIEALAAGNLVVGTAVGGIVDILNHEENSLIVPVGDDQKIVEAVIRLVTNRELARVLRENANQFIGEKYDWKIIAGQMNDIFDEVKV